MQNLPILIDQDGVLADFVKGLYVNLKWRLTPEQFALLPDPNALTKFYVDESINTGDLATDQLLKAAVCEIVDEYAGLFLHLPVIEGAVHYVQQLKTEAAREGIDVVICTAPHIENRTCHSDKARWVHTHLGQAWAKNMIMTHDKTLVQGLVLVDDKPKIKGALTPTWRHIVFDTSYNQSTPGPRVHGWNEQTVDSILDHALRMQIVNGLGQGSNV